jgi:CDP-glycerol glycerophosphotransferase
VKSTWRGFWLTLRAQVIVVTHGLGDANRYATRGAFILQLWHGIPLKRINLDSQRTTNSAILPNARWVQKTLAALYRLAASTISFMPAASEVSAARLRTAFGLDSERVVVTGDPRDDVLCEGTDIERTANARAALLRALAVAELPQRVLLYAPTWRDGDADPAVPSDTEWALIDRWLQSADAALIIRPHPLGLGSYAAGVTTSERVHLLDSTARSDINPVLAGVDILITDYSSIALDFALLGRPIAFLAADLDPYANSRGLYEDYSSFSGGHHVTSWPAVLELIGERDSGTPTRKVGLAELAGHATALATRYHAFRDGHNTERVYLEVTRRLGVR